MILKHYLVLFMGLLFLLSELCPTESKKTFRKFGVFNNNQKHVSNRYKSHQRKLEDIEMQNEMNRRRIFQEQFFKRLQRSNFRDHMLK